MTISGYSANYFNDKDKKLYVATQILSALLSTNTVDYGLVDEDLVDTSIEYAELLLKKLKEEV